MLLAKKFSFQDVFNLNTSFHRTEDSSNGIKHELGFREDVKKFIKKLEDHTENSRHMAHRRKPNRREKNGSNW